MSSLFCKLLPLRPLASLIQFLQRLIIVETLLTICDYFEPHEVLFLFQISLCSNFTAFTPQKVKLHIKPNFKHALPWGIDMK